MASLGDVQSRLRPLVGSNLEQFDTLWRMIETLARKSSLPKTPLSWLTPVDVRAVGTIIHAMDWCVKPLSIGQDEIEILPYSSIGREITLIRLGLPGFFPIGNCLRINFPVPTQSPVEAQRVNLLEKALLPMFTHYAASFSQAFVRKVIEDQLSSLVVALLYPLTYCVAGREEEVERFIALLNLWLTG